MAKVSKREWTAPNGERKSAWTVRYVHGGRHRSKQFEKKKDADAFRVRMEGEIGRGAPLLDQVTTVGKVARDYLLARQTMCQDGAIARGSLEREKHHLEKGVIPFFDKMPLASLTVQDIDAHFARLRGRKRVWGGKNLVPSTVKKIIQEFARVLDYAKRRNLVSINVAREVLSWPEHRKAKSAKIRTFSIEDMRALVAVLSKRRAYQMERSHVMGRAMIYLAAFCGLRFGEISGLTEDTVDLARRVVRVRHSMDRWDNHKGPKTASGLRDVPMPAIVADALRAWAPFRVENGRRLFFMTRQGKSIRNANFHRDNWHSKLVEAGLGPDESGRLFHFHALRHFFASMMIKGRVSLTDVAQLMGHRSFDQTLMTYAHPVSDVDHRSQMLEDLALDFVLPAAPNCAGVAHGTPN